ncbi:DUF881 domain-containing protein [Gephyromycinifex aptenodytis]|uniref:DUF881 domain-containing protein n=1 Tax=Gephyromycinifex aptenodytis TaxID=2716227 RepID=UPI001447B2FF|nr:DUF881 domain-containing protein [Gephyromycinifex aptenodytis]
MTRRVDESMTLLNEMLERPLDPSYAAAAQRRRSEGRQPDRTWTSPWVLAVLVLTGLLLGVSVVNIGALARPAERAASRAELISRISDGEAQVAARSAQITRLQSDVQQLQSSTMGGAEADRLRDLSAVAGSTAVSGPGLRITLDDQGDTDVAPGSQPRENGADDTGRVVARDVVYLTNALWQAGAEAVAVNGHRLTSGTAIRAAGQAITVGFRPLSRPYVIEAVLGPQSSTQFTTGAGGQYLAELRNSYQLRAASRPVNDLSLPAGEVLTLRQAHVPSTPGVTPPAASPSMSNPTRESSQ